MTTALIPSDVVTEIVACRDAAVELYAEFCRDLEAAHRKASQARALVMQACQGEVRHAYVDGKIQEIEEFHTACSVPDYERVQRVAARLVDLQVWGAIVERTNLEHLMDKKAKDELREKLAYVPERVDRHTAKLINAKEIARACPPVTVENVHATVEGFVSEAGTIWRRGVANAFSGLDRRFKSHDGFAIGSRVILTRCFDEYGSWNYYSNTRDTLIDIERVFLVLDGKGPRATYAGIVGAIQEARNGQWGSRQSVHEGDYFRVRAFKNGNAHLWFTRDDLVEKVNHVLADHYSLGWRDGDREDPEAPFSGAVERAPARNFGLFPTPDALADRLIEQADLYVAEDGEALTILEPSAGTGQLASRAAAFARYRETRPIGHRVTCVEVQPQLAAELEDGPYSRVVCRDFLSMSPEPVYDRILMNPPFDRGRDIDHVRHALRFLRPGGRLVAITSASASVGTSAKHEAFRKALEQVGKAQWVDLPAGSFAEAGTYVNTCLLTVQGRGR